MTFKVGDRVKFLNDHGGGIVTKIISSSLVSVQIEDGFEIPTIVTELIKAEETAQTHQHLFMDEVRQSQSLPSQPVLQDQAESNFDERSSSLEIFRSKGNDKKGVYLAYVPHDQKWLLTGLLDVYLVNYTDYEILFSLFLRKSNGAWHGEDYDVVKPNSKILLDSIQREHIEKWSYGILQILFHKELSSKVLSPLSSVFSFKPAKLYRENSYQDSTFISGKSFLLIVAEIDVHPTVAESQTDEKFDEEIQQQAARPKQPEEFINKHKTSPREAVVDLHIEELTDDSAKMSPNEILNYQLNYFVRCLESAMKNYLTKVIFIHGVGEGVLKEKMAQILKEYENVRTRDASMHKFGYGATEVLIWHSNSV
ncbi:MAG TPA: DUF2027 domain-containing protein [Bacteroidales bacterium]|nr:DUF2027 domain-containing protein [Bacteroidales bacterium]HPR58343.1 DUF2027 domain-containing protein [Bacteroidales bacterium]HRW96297.1 DUF2027 domain-containing protein [Bacteroidales bacterium]